MRLYVHDVHVYTHSYLYIEYLVYQVIGRHVFVGTYTHVYTHTSIHEHA